jgi:hypothetical protein
MKLPETIRQAFIEFGRQGGVARAKSLTPAQRSAIAKKAVDAREKKRKLAKKAEKIESK